MMRALMMAVFAICNFIRLSQGAAFAFAGARSKSVSAAGSPFLRNIIPPELTRHDEIHCVDPNAGLAGRSRWIRSTHRRPVLWLPSAQNNHAAKRSGSRPTSIGKDDRSLDLSIGD